MNRRQQKALRKFLGKLAHGSDALLSDDKLIQRFVSQHDELAFEALVKRYSPLVRRVCQRMMPHSSDCDDVFQGTFLLLARKARSLKDKNAVGPWLHGVAVQLARNATRSARRSSCWCSRLPPSSTPSSRRGSCRKR